MDNDFVADLHSIQALSGWEVSLGRHRAPLQTLPGCFRPDIYGGADESDWEKTVGVAGFGFSNSNETEEKQVRRGRYGQ